MKESDTRFSLKATLKSLFVLYGFLIWANLIWLVIWVRFWVEWTFKYTQLPCHAFWEYLKIFFSYCKILWCPKWGSYSITSFEDSSRVKAKNTDMPNCNLSCKRKFNVHFNFGFFFWKYSNSRCVHFSSDL